MDKNYGSGSGKPAPRWSVLAPVVPRASELRPQWNTVNISATGMFVTGMPLLRPGSVAEVDIVLSPSLGITSRVEVVWTRGQPDASRNRPAGMGMRFVGIDARMQAELMAYLGELSTRQSAIPSQPPATVVDRPPPPPRGPRVLKKGDKLGRYTILDRLGAGAMGDVYLAEHTLLGRRVALKLLKDEYVTDRSALRRLHDEARQVNQLAHDNIVPIIDIAVEEDHVFIVMELLIGQNLADVLGRAGPLPLSRIVAVASQLCSVLDVAHRAGIVHADLKPQNIMLVRHVVTQDFVKLVDFGIAKLRTGASLEGAQTLSGEMMGSPGYTAPEQLTGGPVDARTDIYSLGCVLFALITAQPPFRAVTWAEMLVRQLQEAPRAPSTVLGKGVPRGLDEIVVRCLDREPRNRPGSVLEIAEVLRPLV